MSDILNKGRSLAIAACSKVWKLSYTSPVCYPSPAKRRAAGNRALPVLHIATTALAADRNASHTASP